MSSHRSLLASFAQGAVAAVLGLTAAPAAAQFPLIYTWPGASPCDGTLQACIDAAGAEDTVEIASDGPIDEDIVSYGSLDLVAAFGFTPRFAPGRSVVANTSGSSDQAIRIQGLTLDGGSIDVYHLQNGGALIASVLDNVIESWDAPDNAIDLYSTQSGPVVFRIDGNEIECVGSASGGIRVLADRDFMSGDIEDNQVLGAGLSACRYGMDLYVQDGSLLADIFRNVLDLEGAEWGVRARGNGIAVRVAGNAFRSFNLGDISEAITLFDPATPDGSIDSRIVNNTIHSSSKGIVVEGGGDVLVANNILSRIFFTGLTVASPASVTNRNNLFWDIDLADVEGTTAGPGSVFADPGLGFYDFRIPPTSPAADAADGTALPGEFATTDLYGATRVQGAALDIGAAEAPEPGAALAAAIALATLRKLGVRPRT